MGEQSAFGLGGAGHTSPALSDSEVTGSLGARGDSQRLLLRSPIQGKSNAVGLGRELGRLTAVDNLLDDFRRKEGQANQLADVLLAEVFSAGNLHP